MIKVEMTVFEMVTLCSMGINAELQARIVAALEDAVGSGSTKEDKNKKYRFSLLSYNPERKIPVIKEIRAAYHWGLKETKDWVEQAESITPPDYYDNAYNLRATLVALGCFCGQLVEVEDTTKS